KLTRDNYVLWHAQVMPSIRGALLVGFINGNTLAPAEEIKIEKDGKTVKVPNPEYAAWLVKDQQLLGFLLNSLNKEVLVQVADICSSAEVWAALWEMFSSHSRAR